MASSSKRARTDAFERELEPSEIDCAEKNVTVHGVVTELSPVKASKRNPSTKYLTGKITDGKTTMRFVSFDPSLRRTVDGYCKGSTPVALSQCQVKETALSGSRFEQMTSPRRTNATKSHKAFRSSVSIRSQPTFSFPDGITPVRTHACTHVMAVLIMTCGARSGSPQ